MAYNVIGLSVCPENRRTKNLWKLPKMPETVKSTPHQKPRIKSTTTTKGTGTAAMTAATPRIARLMRRAVVKLTFMEDVGSYV